MCPQAERLRNVRHREECRWRRFGKPSRRASEDGLDSERLRAKVRRGDENYGPPVPRTFNGGGGGAALPGPWAASPPAGSGKESGELENQRRGGLKTQACLSGARARVRAGGT